MPANARPMTATMPAVPAAGKPASARKIVAGQQTPQTDAASGRPTAALHGKLVPGASLASVSGRGRPAIPLSPEDIKVLEATRRGEGVGTFTGNLSEVQRFRTRVSNWCERETNEGRPTRPAFRTIEGNFPNPKKGVAASASITIQYAAISQEEVDSVQ